MSFITDIVSGGAKGLFEGIGSLAKDIRIAITGKDPVKMAEIEAKLLEMEFVAQKAQSDINLEEAKNPNLFVSGWRPFIGWVCGIGVFYHFIGYSLMEWSIEVSGLSIEPPKLDTEGLMSLVIALLGMGALRTFEKVNGASGKH